MARVLITGGGSGIGFAMGEAFAARGDEVWVTDVDADLIGAVPETWRASVVDAGAPEEVAGLFERIGEVWGGLDVLCANAGIAGPTAAVEDVGWADWQRCLDVTLGGAFLCAKHAAPMMKAAGAGVMVLTSSTAGQYGFPYRSPYAAAKWGVIGLMKTLAMELGPFGVRANAICPGPVEGPRIEGVIQREAAKKGMTRDALYAGYAAGCSMGRLVEAVDIAEMAVFLASGAARLVSGQVIAVDGHTVNPDPQV